METQKIANLLYDSDNESSKSATRKWYIIDDQTMDNMAENMKMIQPLNLKQKSLNQIVMITQMHMFLWQEIEKLQMLLQILMLHSKIVLLLQDV